MSKLKSGSKTQQKLLPELLSLSLVGALFLGLSLSETRTETPVSARDLSLNPQLQQLTGRQPASASLLRHTQKLKGPLRIQILSDLNQAASVGDVFQLKAEITSQQNLKAAELSWQIPQGLELVSGFLSSQLTDLKAHHPQEVSIFVRKLVDENIQVHAAVKSSLKSSEFADVAQFNTQHFQELKDVELTIQSKTAEHLKSQGLRQRLFQ